MKPTLKFPFLKKVDFSFIVYFIYCAISGDENNGILRNLFFLVFIWEKYGKGKEWHSTGPESDSELPFPYTEYLSREPLKNHQGT
jgi:hypothetical protein